jgi:phosphatidylserine/phosphatidylglycerophosphate/cardiolipin synthase-like enzyme
MIAFHVPIFAQNTAHEQFYLLPKEKEVALESIIKKIDSAKSSIHISIYNFTHKKIAKAIKKAAKRGVKIEIIFDEKSVKKKQGKTMLYYLAKYKNISIYTLQGKLSKKKKYHGIMHMKMAVIDSKIVIFGSANWTYSAFSNNYELLYISKNYAIAKKFERVFKVLKQKAVLYR